MSRRLTYLCLAGLIVFAATLEVLSIRDKSLTQDEPWHFRYGANILNGDSSRFVDGTMPVTALNALPSKLADLTILSRYRGILGSVPTGRYVTVAFNILIALLVFSWGRCLYGEAAALLALALYVLSPNLIAHSRLITTDVYAAGMTLAVLFSLWRFTKHVSLSNGLLAAVVLGLSQVTKYICILLYPIAIILVGLRHGSALVNALSKRNLKTLRPNLRRAAGYVVLFIVINLLIINACFLFNRTFTPLDQYALRSDAFKRACASLGSLAKIPLPLPYPYLEGIDWGIYRTETGKGFGSMYLFGQLRKIGGFKGYYFFAFLFKVPLATQVLIVVALVAYIRRRRYYDFLKDEVFLLVPAIFFAIYFNFFFKLQIGIRHFLIVFPLLHLFCASLLKAGLPVSRRIKVTLAVLLCYQTISVLSYFPHYIPYFNELVWDRKQAYRILADSNIDWGQDRKYLERYLKQHPDAFVEKTEWRMKRLRERFERNHLKPQFPDSGKIIVSVNNLVGIHDPERYRWLRENYKPVDHIGYSYLIFEISPGDSLSPR